MSLSRDMAASISAALAAGDGLGLDDCHSGVDSVDASASPSASIAASGRAVCCVTSLPFPAGSLLRCGGDGQLLSMGTGGHVDCALVRGVSVRRPANELAARNVAKQRTAKELIKCAWR